MVAMEWSTLPDEPTRSDVAATPEQTMKAEPRDATAGAHATNSTNPGAPVQSAISREYHALLGDLEHLLGKATSMTGEELASAKAALGARIDAARSSIGHAGAAVVDGAKRGARATDEFVTGRPWSAVGITAVAGLLVGFLLGRRSS